MHIGISYEALVSFSDRKGNITVLRQLGIPPLTTTLALLHWSNYLTKLKTTQIAYYVE